MKARFIFSGSIDLEFDDGTPAEVMIHIANQRLAKGELEFELGLDDVSTICRACGCTDDEPCFGGCAWVDGDRDLCTACADAFLQEADPILELRKAVERVNPMLWAMVVEICWPGGRYG